MAKIKLDRNLCIGCGSCQAVCEKRFVLTEDGKSHIVGAENPPSGSQMEELQVEVLECAESAAEACPVQCIYIEK